MQPIRSLLPFLFAWLAATTAVSLAAEEAYTPQFIARTIILEQNYLMIKPSINFSSGTPPQPAPSPTIDYSTGENYLVSYYSCSGFEGTGDCVGAYGKQMRPGFVACNDLPQGTAVAVEGLGILTVWDRGGGLSYKHLDVFVLTREEALQRGVEYRKVKVVAIP